MESLFHKDLKPTHPGELLREVIFPELKMTQMEFAGKLGVSRHTLSELLHEHRAMTPDMAIRLSCVIGGSPGLFVRMQAALDLWEAEKSNKKKYARLKRLDESKAS